MLSIICLILSLISLLISWYQRKVTLYSLLINARTGVPYEFPDGRLYVIKPYEEEEEPA